MNDNKNEDKRENKSKKRKSASSFFSNLNTDNSIEYGFAEKNAKSKSAKWIIGGLVLGITVTGITVPWAFSSCTVNLNRPYSNNESMYSYIDPITGKNVEVTYLEFQNRIESIKPTSTIYEKWDDIFFESTLKTLYNEERDAFLKFKAIYYKLHNNTNPTIENFGADLSNAFDQIKQEQTKILEDNKKTFQKAVGDNWLNNWLKELQTNTIYGPQSINSGDTVASIPSLEKKAISYMVTQKIKSSALARYMGASISQSSWNYTDYDFANSTATNTTEEYTKYTNSENVEVSITTEDAINTWKAYLTKDVNVVLPKNITTENNKVIAVFETKSYSTKYRNPLSVENKQNNSKNTSNHLIDLLNNNFKLGLISSVSISGITPGSTNGAAFSITNDALKSLFKIQNVNSTLATANFAPISRLTSFKGANLINTSTDQNNTDSIENEKDKLFVSTFDTENSILGSSKISEISSLMYSDSSINMFHLAAFSSSENGITSLDSANDDSLFSIYNESKNVNSGNSVIATTTPTNPLNKFIKLLLSISKNTTTPNSIDFTGYDQVKNNWDKLNYGSTAASNTLVTFVKLISENFDDQLEFKNSMNANDFNTQLENSITNLGADDLNFIGQILNCVLIANGGNQGNSGSNNVQTNYEDNLLFQNTIGYWTLYDLTEATNTNTKVTNNIKTYLYVDSNGIKIFSKKFGDFTLEDYKKMAISDLNNTINGGENSNIYYDVSSLFSKLNNDYLIISTLLNSTQQGSAQNQFETDFKNAIKEQLELEKKSSTEEDVNKIFNDFKNYVLQQKNYQLFENINNILNSVPSSLTTIIDSGRTYDFAKQLNDASSAEANKIAIFQTQSKFGTNSILKGIEQIESAFYLKLTNLLTPKNNENSNISKGGK